MNSSPVAIRSTRQPLKRTQSRGPVCHAVVPGEVWKEVVPRNPNNDAA